jgi:hypothetical protein
MGSIEKPVLKRIPADAPIQEFIEAIKKDGGCICTNYANPSSMPSNPSSMPTSRGKENYFLQRLEDAIVFSDVVRLVGRSSSCIRSTK